MANHFRESVNPQSYLTISIAHITIQNSAKSSFQFSAVFQQLLKWSLIAEEILQTIGEGTKQ
jgi:hypothetical protein